MDWFKRTSDRCLQWWRPMPSTYRVGGSVCVTRKIGRRLRAQVEFDGHGPRPFLVNCMVRGNDFYWVQDKKLRFFNLKESDAKTTEA